MAAVKNSLNSLAACGLNCPCPRKDRVGGREGGIVVYILRNEGACV